MTTLLTVVDLERKSKVSRYTWRTWIREGRLRALRLGRRVRVDEDEFLRFLGESAITRKPGTTTPEASAPPPGQERPAVTTRTKPKARPAAQSRSKT
jgi:excisionase family DNA binding protein